MFSALISITLKQWRSHKLRTILTIFSIAIGVGVVFSVLTANVTLAESLKLTVEKLAGKATLQVTAGETGFPEEVLEIVRATQGVKIAEPVVEVIAHTAFKDEPNLMIMGVDATGDQELREYQFEESETDIGDPLIYIAQPKSILISRAFADRNGLKEDDILPLYTSKGKIDFVVRGVFKPIGMGEVFDGQIAVMDVYSAQFVFGRGRNFDRIDIMTDPGVPVETVMQKIQEQLPIGIEVERPEARGEGLENSVAGMTLGMTITSFISLLVGFFIIFNSFTISVNQRWKEIGILRALGVERKNVSKMFLGEAVLMGLIGSIIGVGLGFNMAVGASKFMTFMAAQVYGQVTTSIPPVFQFDYAVASFLMGLITSLLAAWFPARSASQLNPVMALHNIEVRDQKKVSGNKRMIAGAMLIIVGLLLIRFTTSQAGLSSQFSYAILLMLGLVLMLPKLSALIAQLLRPIMDRLFGSEGVLAVDTITQSPRRTLGTVGALMICLMFVFSTAAYVTSFKQQLTGSLERTINADFYISTTDQARNRTYHFSEELGNRIAALPEVKRVENVRFTFVSYKDDTVALVAVEMDGLFDRVKSFFLEGDEDKAKELMVRGEGVLVSSNYIKRHGGKVGDIFRVEAPKGTLERPIIGVIEDFSSEKGAFFLDRALYKEYWQDSAVDFVDISLKPGVDKAAFKQELKRITAGEQRAFIYTGLEYRKHILNLVDGFFLLNYMQMVIAIFVAAIGIFNTLVISVSERKREIGVLRSIGGLRSQIRKMVVLEAVAIAIIGTIAGAIGGLLNTYFLVHTAAMIIGGFIIPFNFSVTLVLVILPIVILVAIAAAWWPARSAVNLKVVEAIGYE
jgi:putative ABC transport system permease protein